MASRSDVVVVVTAALLLSACSQSRPTSSPTATSSARSRLEVRMTRQGCAPVRLASRAGLIDFDLANQTASAASYQVLSGDHVVGQIERLGAGQSATLSVDLTPGAYRTQCQIGASAWPGGLAVGGVTGSVALGQAPDLLSAATGYRSFLMDRAAGLVAALTALQASVAAGDLAAARLDYDSVRTDYGPLGPAADNFGDAEPVGQSDLAVAIDGPVDAGPDDPARGLRLVEQGLWGSAPVASLAPQVSAVLADAVALRTRIGAMHLDAVEFASGSGGELSQAVGQVTAAPRSRPGTLELIDLRAAADAARGVLTAVHPALQRRDASLDTTLTRRLAQLDGAINATASSVATPGGGPPSLAAVVTASDALADALAEMAPILDRPVR